MKNYFIILIFTFFFVSCEEERCFKCSTNTTYTNQGYAVETTTTYCGITKSQAKMKEKEGSGVTEYYQNGVHVKIVNHTICR